MYLIKATRVTQCSENPPLDSVWTTLPGCKWRQNRRWRAVVSASRTSADTQRTTCENCGRTRCRAAGRWPTVGVGTTSWWCLQNKRMPASAASGCRRRAASPCGTRRCETRRREGWAWQRTARTSTPPRPVAARRTRVRTVASSWTGTWTAPSLTFSWPGSPLGTAALRRWRSSCAETAGPVPRTRCACACADCSCANDNRHCYCIVCRIIIDPVINDTIICKLLKRYRDAPGWSLYFPKNFRRILHYYYVFVWYTYKIFFTCFLTLLVKSNCNVQNFKIKKYLISRLYNYLLRLDWATEHE